MSAFSLFLPIAHGCTRPKPASRWNIFGICQTFDRRRSSHSWHSLRMAGDRNASIARRLEWCKTCRTAEAWMIERLCRLLPSTQKVFRQMEATETRFEKPHQAGTNEHRQALAYAGNRNATARLHGCLDAPARLTKPCLGRNRHCCLKGQ